MVSTVSKTRPPGLNNTQRPVNASATKTKPGAMNGSAAKTSNTTSTAQSPANVKKIKLTQKNNVMPNGTSSPTLNHLPMRKPAPTGATAKSQLNTASGQVNASSNSTVRNHIIDDEAFYKAGGKRPTLAEYKFAETSEEILQKYKAFPPSIEFHMHPTHYRFGNQDAIIPKNSPLIKNFLELVDLGQIPPAAVEVFKEAGVQYYEGCIILQIYDHRGNAPAAPSTPSESSQGQMGPANVATSTAKDQSPQKSAAQGKGNTATAKAAINVQTSTSKKPGAKQGAAVAADKKLAAPTSISTAGAMQPTPPTMTTATSTPTAITAATTATATNTATSTTNPSHTAIEPKTYRTLLRPTPLTIWYDISSGLDGANDRLSDTWALELESKILATTVPRLDLSVPDESSYCPQIPPILQPYASVGTVPDKYGGLHAPNPPTNAKRKKPLHEDLPHQGTEYEEMMLIMDERPPPGTGQFLRLGFVEQWRRKRERERLQRASTANNSSAAVHRR
ncbi:Spt20 family-domain-containing protein [Lipomyces kononenkoae]|uniref:Spt20 family-domain-containing protein n=1 Tax=Lipomyces kononenkoae TaxID=34357 RepID=A0ACC3SW55_LIPKO